jgi:hypothetical protein
MREGVEKLHLQVNKENEGQKHKFSVTESSELSTTSSQHSRKESESSSLDSRQGSGRHSEFRPIFHDGANVISPEVARPRVVNSKSMTLDFVKTSPLPNVQGESDDETENSGNKKPRRIKKRGGSKKRKNRLHHQEKIAGDLPTAVDLPTPTTESSVSDGLLPCDSHEEGVFEMDNDEDMPTPVGNIPRTVSLPIIEENKMEMTEGWASSQYVSAFHPFSDGDLTPIVR